MNKQNYQTTHLVSQLYLWIVKTVFRFIISEKYSFMLVTALYFHCNAIFTNVCLLFKTLEDVCGIDIFRKHWKFHFEIHAIFREVKIVFKESSFFWPNSNIFLIQQKAIYITKHHILGYSWPLMKTFKKHPISKFAHNDFSN